MKLVVYGSGNQDKIGVVHDGETFALESVDASLPSEMNALIPQLPELSGQLERLLQDATPIGGELQLRPPVPRPEKIICIGLNYADHAGETGSEIPKEPVVFNKFPTALCADGENIELPPQSNAVDYEAELVVVIGKEGKNINQTSALDHVAGYTCGHDVSARDWQKSKPQQQWLCGKSFDSFAPIGPYLVTADEITNPHTLNVKMKLNGEVMQDSNTKHFIFNVNHLIAYLSQVCTLKPGDLLFTGTPPGVGAARKPPVFLRPGDVAEIEIEGIGTLTNPVVAGR